MLLLGHGDIGPKLLLRAMSGSMVLRQLGSVLMSLACVTTGVIGNMLVEIQSVAETTLLPLALG